MHMEKRTHTIEGTIRVTRKEIGYVDIPDTDESVLIEPNDLKMALHKDTVRVLLHPKKKDDQQTGEVLEIIFRNKMRFVGTIEKSEDSCVLVPDDQKMYRNIMVARKDTQNVENGDKALVEITKWTDIKMNPLGNVIEVIGKKGDNDAEMNAIVLDKGLSIAFPRAVEEEAKKLSKEISATEVARRRDMRKISTFTIDPADAKDFDDALSTQILDTGDIEIGIHIADVSHYVKKGTALDTEAAKRATSIYLVDRTIPMLPETLSNNLCSLNPNEDKLTFSAIFTFDGQALKQKKIKIINEWFGRTIIHSDKRFTYEDAQESLDTKKGPEAQELHTLDTIALLLRRDRFKNGAIAFEKDEVRFELNEHGVPIRAYVKERIETNKLIEDFMLLANKKVAEFIGKKDKRIEKTFIYRVHDVPDVDRMRELSAFLKTVGYDLHVDENGVSSKDVNRLLNEVQGTAEENMIQTATIRTMAKAVYSTKNIGHYGLSFEHYTHFTSPIRRYPDIMVHRLLARYLTGETIPEEEIEKFEAASRYASGMEQTATEAERDSIKYKQVEYMKNYVGEKFKGIISGVTKWGVYVQEKETHAEGLVHVRDMDDFFTLDEKNYALIGERTKKRYRLGDEVAIKIAAADLDTRTLDFVFVKEKKQNNRY